MSGSLFSPGQPSKLFSFPVTMPTVLSPSGDSITTTLKASNTDFLRAELSLCTKSLKKNTDENSLRMLR